MHNKHDITLVNNLIEITLDSANGYAEAAKETKSEPLASLFRARSGERHAVAALLRDYVRSAGGEPEDDGSVLASAHRLFLNLRVALSLQDNAVVVEEVERGEDHIKSRFEDAMKDDAASPETIAVIADAYISIHSGHDQMRDIKRGFDDQ